MQYGFVLPYGDARTAADFAQAAEAAGWDGFFVWEPVWGWDAWVMLTAAALCTERIRLGTMITPLSRMRPWELASKTVTLDHLSNGRVILAVGLGAIDTGFAEFGEVTDRKTRAELLDEGLDILNGLWHGQPFNYDGKHYHIRGNEVLSLAPAGAAAAHSHLGRRRVAEEEIHAAGAALRRLAAQRDERSRAAHRDHRRSRPRDESVHRCTSHRDDTVRHCGRRQNAGR